MNTFMMSHPLTDQHIKTLCSFGYEEIPAISKKLACGDVGCGAMAEVKTIIDKIVSKFGQKDTS
jgi:phosphopantothenoylcysteine decarboxylase